MSNIDVSVIIPAYDAEGTLVAAVDSIMSAKAGYSIEIIIVDDGSNDETLMVARSLVAKYPELIILNNKGPQGPSAARNTGLDIAKGTYVSFLDADDIWHENHLYLMIGFLKRHPVLDSVFSNSEVRELGSDVPLGLWLDKHRALDIIDKSYLEKDLYLIEGDFCRALITDSFLHVQSLIVKRDSMGDLRFNEKLLRSEDRDFGARMYRRGLQIGYSRISTNVYFKGTNSLTSQGDANGLITNLNHIQLFVGYLNNLSDYQSLLRREISLRYANIAYLHRKNGRYGDSLGAVIQGLKFKASLRLWSEAVKVFAFGLAHPICFLVKNRELQSL